MLLPGKKNQLHNYRRKKTCPGSSSAEKDLEVDGSQGKQESVAPQYCRKSNAALT